MSDNLVHCELDGDVLVARLDDGKANALSPNMLTALDGALERAEREAKAIVLAGRPGRFCAGFDLKHMMAGPDSARALVTQGADVLLRAYVHPQPVVIACTGHALAGGALLALTGDWRVGTEGEFQIGLNELAIGMALPILALEFARDRLAPKRLTEATLLAKIFTPADAVSVGYLDELASADDVVARAIGKAQRLVSLSGSSYAQSKRSLRGATVKHIRDTLAANMAEFGQG